MGLETKLSSNQCYKPQKRQNVSERAKKRGSKRPLSKKKARETPEELKGPKSARKARKKREKRQKSPKRGRKYPKKPEKARRVSKGLKTSETSQF